MSSELADRPDSPDHAALAEIYVAAYVERARRERMGGQQDFSAPGVNGLLSADGRSQARLLITDDRALHALELLPAQIVGGLVNIFHTAPRCVELFRADGNWSHTDDTALVRRNLEAVPETPLIPELRIAPIRRRLDDPEDGVDLSAAVAVTVAADPGFEGSPAGFMAYLRTAPPELKLFSAVQADGAPVATSGVAVYGTEARVVFVNTLEQWRRNGIARAMTAHALTYARQAGATRATLDGTALGRPVYERLGFEAVSGIARFSRGL